MNRKIKGIPASSGIAVGVAYCIGKEEFTITRTTIPSSEIPTEIFRFEDALIKTRKEIVSLQKKIAQDLGFDHAQIFDAHLLVLEDRVLVEDVISQIRNHRVNVEFAFSQSIKRYIDAFSKLEDEYLKERVIDINDVSRRVLSKLLKKEKTSLAHLKEKVIIVAHDLSPSDTAALPKKFIIGFVTDIGGTTSHTAIIARSLGIPAIVGAERATQQIKSGETIIVDGQEGVIIANPTDKILRAYEQKLKRERKASKAYAIYRHLKAQTKDKQRTVEIAANIELPEEIPLVEEFGAEGIGLYRTEYVFLGKKELPNEEEQFKAYNAVAESARPAKVIVRTLDIGGDKFLSRPEIPQDMHPFLGWRAIRFCLARPDVFKTQLRAILRASIYGNLKIMFPMISGVEELREAKKLLNQAKEELRKEGVHYDDHIPVGIMIEVPSAAMTADILAKESDFFSIGTNDLIQYSLAVDRGNEKVAYLYEPAHPGVLRLLQHIIRTGKDNNIWVGMCGEMASELMFAYVLVGMGLDELSMPPPRIPKIKKLIRSITLTDAKRVAEEVVKLSTAKEVERYIIAQLKETLKAEDIAEILL